MIFSQPVPAGCFIMLNQNGSQRPSNRPAACRTELDTGFNAVVLLALPRPRQVALVIPLSLLQVCLLTGAA